MPVGKRGAERLTNPHRFKVHESTLRWGRTCGAEAEGFEWTSFVMRWGGQAIGKHGSNFDAHLRAQVLAQHAQRLL